MYTFPEVSTATPRLVSQPDPPNCRAHTYVPDEFNLTTNASSLPADVRLAVPALGSKSAVPSNSPVTYVFPEVSTATPRLVSQPNPANCRAHTYVPDEFNLTTNASWVPADVRLAVPALGSKSAVPSNPPVMYIFPEVSTATPRLVSEPDPPNCRAHTYDPDTSNLRTYASRTPLAVRFAAPALGSKSTVPAKDPVTYVFPEVSTATPTLSSEPDPPKTETVAFASVGVHARRICGIAANTPNTVRTAMKIRRTP
jgi:hypothetical protein